MKSWARDQLGGKLGLALPTFAICAANSDPDNLVDEYTFLYLDPITAVPYNLKWSLSYCSRVSNEVLMIGVELNI